MKKQALVALATAVLIGLAPVATFANADGVEENPSAIVDAVEEAEEEGITVANGLPEGMPADLSEGGNTGSSPAPELPVSTGPAVQNRPKIVIDSYKTEPEQVQAGENFALQLTFYNTNGVNSIRNMKVTLASTDTTQASGPVFIPAGTSNTFYSRYLAPEDEVTKRIDMYVVPDASQRTYTLTAMFEYEDADGNEFTTSENISIPVVQKTELTMGQINMPSELYTYQPQYLSVPFYNTGKTTLYNVTARIETAMQNDNPQTYMGNMASGTQDSYDVNITPEEAGDTSGKIIFTYQDVSGKEYTQELPFQAHVIEMMDPSMDDPSMTEDFVQEPATPVFMSPVLWIGALALLALIVVLIRRRKKNKEDRELEIND